jgi:hypothetical protein
MNERIGDLAAKRKRWVESNKDNGFEEGIRRVLTDLYPDNAHFIYELLQNAEDTRAQIAQFTVNNDSLSFKHNGPRLFTLKDVESITSIGNSTKRYDPTSIGKFGVGFKAVFAYTNTPEVYSGEYAFRIRDLVVPESIERQDAKRETAFNFPFNHPNKRSERAVNEISHGLKALGDNTLLFLQYIQKIEYQLPNGAGTQERIEHGNNHIEIRSSGTKGKAISHWLRFEKIVKVRDEDTKTKDCRIAIAYRLEADGTTKKKVGGWKIMPLDHGQVSIFFPAEKETSNLRFHLHAPFASTVARDSVRDCDANNELRNHLADLVVESLATLRDRGLLDVGFLAVLPNTRDNLTDFYQPIRTAVVEAFRTEALTPTRSGIHQCADGLYRGPAVIQEVIDDKDLSLLTDYEVPLWAKNPPQENQREANFLGDLSIDEWGWSELARTLSEPVFDEDKRTSIEGWISSKDDAWLFRFNALLGEAQDEHNKNIDVSNLRFVRVETSDGNDHITAGEAYFPPDDEVTPAPDDVAFVKPSTYVSGRSEQRKRYARSFLESAGVRSFDEKAVIERSLGLYGDGQSVAVKTHIRHIREFIKHWKQKPADADLFRNAPFLADSVNNGRVEETYLASDLCLDLPFEETGLTDAYSIHDKSPVWTGYQAELGANMSNDFVLFLKDIGVMHALEVKCVSTNGNPQAKTLRQDFYLYGVRYTSTHINRDYTINKLTDYLNFNSELISRLVWNTLIKADREAAVACFRPNKQYETREAESQLVAHLKQYAWIPDKQGQFRKPQDLTRDDLRDDFPYNDRNGLLTAIGFGENAKQRSEEYQARSHNAQKLGFASVEEAEQFAKLKREGITPADIRAFYAQRKQPDQPEQSVPNPGRRRVNILNDAEDAPSKESVQRERSIQVGISKVTAQAKAYLRAKYKNADGQLVCQCCHEEMPFKLSAGDHYFEAVQCMRDQDARHHQNRLALCPTCAAMYQYARETDDAEVRRRIVEHNADDQVPAVEILINLAGSERHLRFVGTHWFDLKIILKGAHHV